MNIVRKDIDQNNAIVTLQIVKADYEEKVNKSLRDYRKKANIPGFRPGMIPVGLVKKMYGKAVLAEEINKLVSDELFKYIRESNISMLGEPMPNETEQRELDFNTQEDFEFVFDIGIAPEFDLELSDKDEVKYYNIAVSDEMIQNQLKSHTGRYGTYVQEETVEDKDMLKGQMLELADGEVLEGGLEVIDAVLTPAYIKDEATRALFVGAKKGDVIRFNPKIAMVDIAEISSLLKVTKEEAEFVTADFQMTIAEITRYHEAEVNQELFDKVYGDGVVTSEEEFMSKISAGIAETLVSDSDYKFGVDAREMLLAKYKDLAFPDSLLKRWVLATNEELTEETLEADYDKMITDLKWQLIKDKIAKANKIEVKMDDLLDYAKKMANAQFVQYGMVGMDDALITSYANDMLKKEETVKAIAERVAESKVYEQVKSVVKLDSQEISVEDFNKMFEN